MVRKNSLWITHSIIVLHHKNLRNTTMHFSNQFKKPNININAQNSPSFRTPYIMRILFFHSLEKDRVVITRLFNVKPTFAQQSLPPEGNRQTSHNHASYCLIAASHHNKHRLSGQYDGKQRHQNCGATHHDDVIKWKHVPRYWPIARGIHRSPGIPRTKASDAELWCFLWSGPE